VLPGQHQAFGFWLAHLYLCAELSTYAIARLTGLDRQRVGRLLGKAGVSLRPRGAGGVRPERRPGDPAGLAGMLRCLYVDRGLTTIEIAALLGMPDRTVRDRLRRYGIPARTRGCWRREDRRVLPADLLSMLYSADGFTADEIGRKLGASRNAVLRAAHDLGVPVRAGGAVIQPGPQEIELIDALYADPLVAAALARHEIARVPAGGPIWQRFPEPVPLTVRLVEDLYWESGVGLNHIELLTGQPAQTVRGFMHRAMIATRHPGGRSPFLRRWRLSAGPACPPGGARVPEEDRRAPEEGQSARN
jgi:hypothetical protein